MVNMGIPIRIKNDNKDDLYRECVKDYDFIGSYGTPNTYTADLPESVRSRYSRLDSTQRVAYVNPNNSYV